MDGTFLKDDLEDTFLRNDYRYVHIASHGQFSGDAANTFVLTYDEYLTLDDLESRTILTKGVQNDERPYILYLESRDRTDIAPS